MRVRVLFVCEDNSARSILAEALLNEMGRGDFEAYSAGVHPTAVHRLTSEVLRENCLDSTACRSKSHMEFAGDTFDYVITLCERGEEPHLASVAWPGTALCWGFPDPVQAPGNDEDRLRAFRRTIRELRQRISLFIIIAEREAPTRAERQPALVA